jgi:hypothetical protein
MLEITAIFRYFRYFGQANRVIIIIITPSLKSKAIIYSWINIAFGVSKIDFMNFN